MQNYVAAAPTQSGVYNPRDSGLIFTLSVVCVLLVSVIYQAASEVIPMGKYTSSFLIQLTFLAVILLYTKYFKGSLSALKPVKFTPAEMYFPVLMCVGLGLTMMFAFAVPAGLFQSALESLGYSSQTGLVITTPGDVLKAVLFVALMPAICEEFLFRGAILQGLRGFGDMFAITATALMFMLMHQNPEQTVFPFLSGLVLGLVFVRSGNLIFPIIVHFLNNTLVIFVTYYDIDTLYVNDIPVTTVLIIAGIAGFVALMVLWLRRKPFAMAATPHYKIIIYDNIAMLRSLGTLIRPDPNEYLMQSRQQSAINDGHLGTEIFGGGEKYMYYGKKAAFYLNSPMGTDNATPPYFKDVSENSYYNPYKTGKTSFWLYALAGVSLCAVFWLIVFFMGITI